MLEYNGPIDIGGVGELKTQSRHGIYTLQLPLHNGGTAVMTGIWLHTITSTFPEYPPRGRVEKDIQNAYLSHGGKISDLPKLPNVVGGSVDFMVDIKYLRYHPRQIFQLPSGLTFYQSAFTNADCTTGVIGGPHQLFTQIENHFHVNGNNTSTFLCDQLTLYHQGYQVNPDISVLGFKTNDIDLHFNSKISNVHLSQHIKLHEECEAAGANISYRCVKCRSCIECKHHDTLEEISIKEEVEQNIIDKSVVVDVDNRCTIASLPFTREPRMRLVPNRHKALKTLNQQIKKLNKNEKDKNDVIASEAKLQSLGHVDYVSNLSSKQQQMLQEDTWRAVWKDSSLSTPCRLVFDASQPTDSGYSLNDVVAKGRNNMNRLQEILIRWFTHKVGYHTDIQKMHNTVKL